MHNFPSHLAPLYPHRTLWRYTNIVLLLLLVLQLHYPKYNTLATEQARFRLGDGSEEITDDVIN